MEEHLQNKRIIKEVRKYEHLYDVRRKDYKDSVKKENSWMEIANLLELDVNAVKKRWKNLRDTYARKIKESKRLNRSGVQTAKQEKWPYFGMLNYLRDIVKTRASSFCITPSTPVTIDLAEVEIKQEDRGSESDGAALPTTPSAVDSGDYRVREGVENVTVDNASPVNMNSTSKDTAESFGRYVAAEMRDLPRHQQQWARYKISEILYQATTIPSPVHTQKFDPASTSSQ